MKMNKTAAFNFLSNISLGNNNNNNNNSNNNQITTNNNNTQQSQLTISKYLSKPITKSGGDLQTAHSWIFNLPLPTYKAIDPKVGSKITLNIKQKHVILKLGDRFYFSISVPTKIDRIVSSSTVISDPVQSKEDTHTSNVVLQVEKVFTDPIPRNIFASYPLLSDLQTSKSSFTSVTDHQATQFLEVITNYTTKTVKKEAINFLTGISLGDKTKSENSPNTSSTTPRNLNDNNVNNIPPISLNNNIVANTTVNNIQQPPPSQQQNINIPIAQQPPPLQQLQPQLKDLQPQPPLQQLQPQQQTILNKQLQQPPPPQQAKQVNNTSVDNLNLTNANIQPIIKPPRKYNTIEEYNSNYNITLNQRIYFVSSGHPVSVFSMIKGDSRRALPRKSQSGKTKDSNLIQSSHMDSTLGTLDTHNEKTVFHKETSYGHLLSSQFINSSLIGDEIDINGIPLKYNPSFLDNAELKTGKHRTVMNLPSYRISILPFIKKGAIKEELNEQFRQKHSWISTGVTLYKIRKIKRKLKKITLIADLDISTLALSFVLIEKMIMKNQISKPNIKLYSAVCLLLAAKFNDSKALESLESLYETIEKKFSITKKELLANEFPIYSLVSFGLFIDYHDVLPHLNRLKSELVESDQIIMPLVK